MRRAASVAAGVVVVTSDKCYRRPDRAVREGDPLGGHDPYSASKACAEIVTAAYRGRYFSPEAGVGVATARAGNVIGGGDLAADRLVPDLVRAFAAGRPAVLRHPGGGPPLAACAGRAGRLPPPGPAPDQDPGRFAGRLELRPRRGGVDSGQSRDRGRVRFGRRRPGAPAASHARA